MKIELSAKECEYLADKTFWDWKRAEIDTRTADIIFKGDKKYMKAAEKAERFLRELHNKLDPQWEERKNEQNKSIHI